MKPIHTIGIDIGSGAVKSVLFSFDEQGQPTWLAKRCERIRRRDPMTLASEGRDGVLEDAKLAANEKVKKEGAIHVEADSTLPYAVVVTAMAVAKPPSFQSFLRFLFRDFMFRWVCVPELEGA